MHTLQLIAPRPDHAELSRFAAERHAVLTAIQQRRVASRRVRAERAIRISPRPLIGLALAIIGGAPRRP